PPTPRHPQTATAGRNPQRVSPRRLTCTDDISGNHKVRFLIRDRDGKYSALIDKIRSTAGIATMLTGIRIPRMNSVTERWVKTLRTELLDRMLIWN
ncbi:integrase, partial [Saccharothrix longispora]|uniref:integrase n=1 Tax=Saccharothrix longispora TaxID=33920 RepID=UPI0028FD4DDD